MSPDFEKTQTMNIALPLLLLSLAGVYSQTVPYASFKGNNLVDHDYVDLNKSEMIRVEPTVCSVTLTWPNAAVQLRVAIVPTGISPPVTDLRYRKH